MPTYRINLGHPLTELRDEFDRLWGNLVAAPPLHGWGVGPAAAAFPAVNMRETAEAVIVEAELPGVEPGSLEISVVGDELVLEGARPGPQPEAGRGAGAARPGDAGRDQPDEPGASGGAVTWHRRERGTGGFKRRLTLPVAVDAAGVEARLADGVLTVTCPKVPEVQARKVPVRTG